MRRIGRQNPCNNGPAKLADRVDLVRDGYEDENVEENGSDSLKGHPFRSVRRVQ